MKSPPRLRAVPAIPVRRGLIGRRWNGAILFLLQNGATRFASCARASPASPTRCLGGACANSESEGWSCATCTTARPMGSSTRSATKGHAPLACSPRSATGVSTGWTRRAGKASGPPLLATARFGQKHASKGALSASSRSSLPRRAAVPRARNATAPTMNRNDTQSVTAGGLRWKNHASSSVDVVPASSDVMRFHEAPRTSPCVPGT